MASWDSQTKSGGTSISVGMPLGMLLTLTYATASTGGATWTADTKHTTTFTNQTKN